MPTYYLEARVPARVFSAMQGADFRLQCSKFYRADHGDLRPVSQGWSMVSAEAVDTGGVYALYDNQPAPLRLSCLYQHVRGIRFAPPEILYLIIPISPIPIGGTRFFHIRHWLL